MWKWYFTVVWICLSLMTNDIEHLLYIFFGEILIQILCPFLNWVIFFLLLSCGNYLYILDTYLFSDTWFANISSHSVGYLFIWFCPLVCRTWILLKFSIYVFLWLLLLLVSYLQIHCQSQDHKDLLLKRKKINSYVFFKEFHCFSSYI